MTTPDNVKTSSILHKTQKKIILTVNSERDRQENDR